MDTVNKLLHLVFVGRLEGEKGIDVILGLIKYLGNSPELALSLRLSICGDGTMRENILENTTDRRNASFENEAFDFPGVYYYGKREAREIQFLYTKADLAIVPSRFLETFGLSALEALSSGVPVIGFRKGGLTSFISESLALDPERGVESLIKKINNIQQNSIPEVIDVSIYGQKEWTKRLDALLSGNTNILVIHDYESIIGGAEYYVQGTIRSMKEMGKNVSFFGLVGNTSPLKRRVMFIFSLFNIANYFRISHLLDQEKPDVIWMNSILRYIGFWGMLALKKYSQEYRSVKIFLAHHDVGLLAAFPQHITEENEIPLSVSLREFLPRKLSIIKQFVSIWKWLYIRLLRSVFPVHITHMIFSPFLEKNIRGQFPKDKIMLFPHSVDTDIFHP